MTKLNINNKHFARMLIAIAVFLPMMVITGLKIMNSDGAYANGMWGLYYHANGGHHTGLPDTQYCVPEEGADTCTYTISDIIPKRDGFAFMGWATDRSALEPEYQPGDEITTHACIKNLYAIWGLSLSFELNGGTGDFQPIMCHPIAADVYIEEEELTPADSLCDVTFPTTEPTKDDYFFLGWGEEELSTSATYAPGEKITLSENKVVYAVWTPIYSVIFNANDKTGAVEVLTCHSDETTYGECDIEIPTKTPSRDGYSFLGWATIDDTTSVAFNPGDILNFGGAGRGEVMRGPNRNATKAETKAATKTHIDGQSIMLYAVWKEDVPIPVPDTGLMTTDGDRTGMINNVAIYVAVPSALLVCGWMVKRMTTKKVNFTKRKR